MLSQFDPLLIFAIVIGCLAAMLTIIIIACIICYCARQKDDVERKVG